MRACHKAAQDQAHNGHWTEATRGHSRRWKVPMALLAEGGLARLSAAVARAQPSLPQTYASVALLT